MAFVVENSILCIIEVAVYQDMERERQIKRNVDKYTMDSVNLGGLIHECFGGPSYL